MLDLSEAGLQQIECDVATARRGFGGSAYDAEDIIEELIEVLRAERAVSADLRQTIEKLKALEESRWRKVLPQFRRPFGPPLELKQEERPFKQQ